MHRTLLLGLGINLGAVIILLFVCLAFGACSANTTANLASTEVALTVAETSAAAFVQSDPSAAAAVTAAEAAATAILAAGGSTEAAVAKVQAAMQ